ncbi:hypothetical protein XENTR_v10002528 [Xenopus tropicalis]|uniref:Leucine rich repeat containing 43 n=1 Tax=Xenopus tropicalis TaxID=8364 RepID=A0A6I8PRA6_XENTR|nr:leucine-rich repeat-containing protein 43 isoform X1 [Xenopus tropicalis]KAE8635144.1 hypothetical protein XENTR_v10002528 [Xenopus tropicalis]
MAAITGTAALNEQLRSLCLGSFPCGTKGSRNKSSLESGKSLYSDTYWENEDPEEETLDMLQELLTCSRSPWGLEDSWSCEAQQLRQLAVQSPELITNQLIYSHFRSLRVVDKEVTSVDEQLLNFINLEELVLSANKITNASSSSLPQTLKVLELGSNQISTLKDLTVNPPPKLQHLGLAYNRIQHPSESKYFTEEFWPNLVSLDLSFNDLTDIFDLVPNLCSLQHLRILVLQGNPLTFIPAYRGFTIDSLPLLFALDDVPILPDERHQFSGLLNQKGALEKSAMVLVNIGKLRGIPNPTNFLEAQDPGEYPIITYNYYVSYEFIEQETSKEVEHVQTAVPIFSKTVKHPPGTLSSLLPQTPFHTGAYKTSEVPWLDVIDTGYNRKHEVRDLLALKSFLLSGMMVTVTEEKTYCWPVDHNKTAVPKSAKKGEKEKDKGRPSSKGSKAGTKTKNKKENLDEFQRDPPILKTLGFAHVNLDSLVSGEMSVSTICNLEMCSTEPEKQPIVIDKEGKKSKDRKKSGRESVDTHKNSASSAGKTKTKVTSEISPTEEQQVPPEPVPLTLEIQIQIIRLSSASEAQLKHGKLEGFIHKPECK